MLPPTATPYGHTYGEWAAQWWQWALGQPAATNPVLDPTGADCAQGQQGPVWFLAGSFGSDPITRTCTVPSGAALLFPVINLGYFAFSDDPPEQRTEEFVRAQVAAAAGATNLTASVDGVPVADIASYYEQSPLFSVTLPAGNLFGLPEGFVLDPSVDAGYYLMVSPPTAGEHTIHFAATIPSIGFSVDVSYRITVASGGRTHP